MSSAKLVWVKTGPKGSVALTEEVASEFDRVDASVRARILRQMKWFTELELRELNSEAFKFEERFKVTSRPQQGQSKKKAVARNVAIYAFKGWKVRIYGAVEDVRGRRAFIGTEIDASKKQDKANRSLMNSAAVKVAQILG